MTPDFLAGNTRTSFRATARRSVLLPALSGLLLATTLSAAELTTVAVIKVSRTTVAQEALFDAELRPYQEIALHSKVAGYLESIKVDVGDLVTAGQKIATIEVPELQDEIEHAEATLRRSQAEAERARASAEEAHQSYGRLVSADKSQPNLIARQDLDTATAKDRTAQANLAAAKEQILVGEADIKKLKTMQAYAQIVTPFAGVITKRYADPGALIQPGTSSGAVPLVRLSQNDRLRVAFPISLSFVSKIQVGDAVEIRIAGFKQPFAGKVARLSRKVDTATRTMEGEIDLPNTDLKLTPGIYATVAVEFDKRDNVLAVPIEAVARDKNSATVMVITADHKTEERKVTLGLETPTRLEIVAGLTENEQVMIGSRAQVKPGQSVEPKLIELTKAD